ncbi:MAG: YgiT-type zinc finger protein [Magnetococcus sp. YQC-5]
MQCRICGTLLFDTLTMLPFKIGADAIVIVKDLPVAQCSICQEFLIHDGVMERVEALLERVGQTSELEVVRYAA